MPNRKLLLVALCLAAALAAVGGIVFVKESRLSTDGPDSAGRDFWPEKVAPAPPILNAPAARVTSGLNSATDRSFEIEWPASDQPTYFFVACDEGKIEIQMAGGSTAMECDGGKTVLTAVGSHLEDELITVSVDRPQRRSWGAALYA